MKPAIHMLKASIVIAAVLAVPASAADPSDKTFHLGIVRGKVSAQERVMRVDQGDRVHIRAVADAPGELHLHGYRVEATLEPGVAADIVFEAYAAGRYPFEWHASGEGAPRGHHGPPLAAIEVRPK
jgi:hypothetical protein